MPLIIKMRNFLVHDKPTETMDAEVNEEVDKFRTQLKQHVKDLDWIPPIRNTEGHRFWIKGEPAVQKLMKFPVAEWAFRSTNQIADDMRDLVGRQTEQLKLVPSDKIPSPDFDALVTSGRGWQAAGH